MDDCYYDDDELDELEEVGELVSVSERMAPPSVSAASTATTTATIVRMQQQRPHSTAILYDKTPIVATYTYKVQYSNSI